MLAQAIVLKELVQGSHWKRLYVLRAALPVVAAIAIAPGLGSALGGGQMDWRTAAAISRPVFVTCAWMQLGVFSCLATLFCNGCLAAEWERKTMELLCATPITFAGIVYGKLVAGLGRVFAIGLVLLPIQGLYMYLGQIPRGLILRSAGVTASATVLCGALALMEGSWRIKRGRVRGGRADMVLLYFCVTVPLGLLGVAKGFPAAVALVPFWAFRYVLSGTAPGGMSPGVFAGLSIAAPIAMSIAPLVLSPYLFRRFFRRQIGEVGAKRRLFRRRPAKRPPMGAREHPFHWQERAAAMRWMRWSVPALCALFLAFAGVTHIFPALLDEDFLIEPNFYWFCAFVGEGACVLQSIAFCSRVFAREKVTRTAQALVLTGVRAETFFREKIKVLVKAQIPGFAAIVACVIPALLFGEGVPDGHAAAAMLVLLVAAPLLVIAAAVPVMVISASAHSPDNAAEGLGIALALTVFAVYAFIPSVIILTVQASRRRPPTAYGTGTLLAITTAITGVLGLIVAVSTYEVPLVGMLFIAVFVFCHTIMWWSFGVREFANAMVRTGPGDRM